MRSYWDKRARENAFFFVDNSQDYNSTDAEAFWAEGPVALDTLLNGVGAHLTEHDHVVEIGCGVGRLTRPMAERVAAVVALDVSSEMLSRARALNPELDNVTWLLGDGTSLSGIANGEVDVCVSHVVFQHIPDPEVTLGYVREIGRVLRPGGWALFQVSNDPTVHRKRRGLRRFGGVLRAMLGRAPRGQAAASWRGSAVRITDLRAAAQEGGMSIDRIVGEGTQFCVVRLSRDTPVIEPTP